MASAKTAEVLLTCSTPIGVVLIYNIAMAPIYYAQIPFFEQFKIQKDRPWPWLDKRDNIRRAFWALSSKSLKLTAVNMCIVIPLLVVAKVYMIDEMLGRANPHAFDTSDEHWPSLTKNTLNILLLVVLHELGVYVTHRMSHAYPVLYKYHKMHHEYKMNTTLAAQHNHPIDHIFSIAGPGLFALSLVNPHSLTAFQWTLWAMFSNLDEHVGYAFPWSPVRWFPFSASTNEHEFHHSKNIGCFGSKLSIFNSLLGGHEHFNRTKVV